MAFDSNPTAIAGSLRRVWRYAGTPASGTTFAASADPGDLCIDTTNKKLYINTNTLASPTWSQVVTGGVAFSGDLTLTGDIGLTGDITLATEDISVAQGHAIYLDGQDGTEYLIADASNEAMFNAASTINLAIGSVDEVQITSSAVTLPTNNLTLTAGNASVAAGKALYFDGQQGGEFIESVTTDTMLVNATTTLNLGIGAASIVALTANTVTVNKDISLTAGEFLSGAPTKMTITQKTANVYLTAAEAGVIYVTTDNIYLYLPTYVGNAGLQYIVKVGAAFSAGVKVWTFDGGFIDGYGGKKSSAQFDVLDVVCSGTGWYVVGQVGTWSSWAGA